MTAQGSPPEKQPRWARREQGCGIHLPFSHCIGTSALVLRDGSLAMGLEFGGLEFETLDNDEINIALRQREAVLRSLANSRLVLHHYLIRTPVAAGLEPKSDLPGALHVQQEWQKQRDGRAQFINRLFLVVRRRPARDKMGWVDRIESFLGRPVSGADTVSATDLRELEAAIEALTSGLAIYAPRLLRAYASETGTCHELAELLAAVLHGSFEAVRVDHEAARPLGDYLPLRRMSFGQNAIEDGSDTEISSFSTVLGLKEYPAASQAGLLDALSRLPYAMVVSQSFSYVERQLALERIDLAVRRLRAADEESQSLRYGLTTARDELVSGQTGYGQHHFSVCLRTPTLDQLGRATSDTMAALSDIGAVPVREQVNLEPAFWAQFPGNDDYIGRSAIISVSAFAGFASLHNFPIGATENLHWKSPVSVMETSAMTPFFFNFHHGDLGHFTLIGPSGAGKTVVLNFLLAEAQRLAPRTILFDKDRGSEIFVRANKGTYAQIIVGQPTGFNPLALPDSAANRAFLRELIARLIECIGPPLKPAEIALIAGAVDANFDQKPEFRRLTYFRELLGGTARPEPGDIASRLGVWCAGQEYGWLFDNAHDALDLNTPMLGLDMTQILDVPRLRTPCLLYLFHRIDLTLTGAPTLIVIDEGWKALDDDVFTTRLKDWMKTLRKRNAVLGLATQSAGDALDSRIARTLIEQAGTQIFLTNPRAQDQDYVQGFGLTPHETALIRALPLAARAMLIKQGNSSAVARLDLSSMPEVLLMLSGSEETIRQLDAIRSRVGDAVESWWPELVRQVLHRGRSAR